MWIILEGSSDDPCPVCGHYLSHDNPPPSMRGRITRMCRHLVAAVGRFSFSRFVWWNPFTWWAAGEWEIQDIDEPPPQKKPVTTKPAEPKRSETPPGVAEA